LEGNLDASVPTYIFPFEKLEVWQASLELEDYALELLERIPLAHIIHDGSSRNRTDDR
jgi:hypothetical protein